MIRILHLYHDLLDLYGDGGNLLAVSYCLDRMNVQYQIDKKSLYDDIDFMQYDMVYIGVGKDSNINIIAGDILQHKDAITEYVRSGRLMLSIGNSRLLFGKSFTDSSGHIYEGLGLFDYTGTQSSQVFISDDLVRYEDQELYGFINRTSQLENVIDHNLFAIITGYGDGNSDIVFEGTHYRNFFGTWLLGPLLVKNPGFLKMILKELLKDDYRDIDVTFLDKAHDRTIADIHQRIKK